MIKKTYFIFFYLFVSIVKLYSDNNLDIEDKVLFFEERIRPVLAQKCFSCHSAEAEKKGKLKAGLLLDSPQALIKGGDSGSVLVPGDISMSLLYEAVLYKDEDMAMPPKGKLSDGQIKDIKDWILMGAPWPGNDMNKLIANTDDEEPYDWEKFRKEHWSFKSLSKVSIPKIENEIKINNPIDNLESNNKSSVTK